MPRGAARRLIAQGLSALAKAEAAEASALTKSARTFSSLAKAAGQTTARAGGSLAGQCKCSCGKAFCMGKHFTTSVGAGQAQAAMADEAPHAPSLTARHVEVGSPTPIRAIATNVQLRGLGGSCSSDPTMLTCLSPEFAHEHPHLALAPASAATAAEHSAQNMLAGSGRCYIAQQCMLIGHLPTAVELALTCPACLLLLQVTKHFPLSLGVDDFMARLEMALAAYGFTGDNAIGEQHSLLLLTCCPRCWCELSTCLLHQQRV